MTQDRVRATHGASGPWREDGTISTNIPPTQSRTHHSFPGVRPHQEAPHALQPGVRKGGQRLAKRTPRARQRAQPSVGSATKPPSSWKIGFFYLDASDGCGL